MKNHIQFRTSLADVVPTAGDVPPVVLVGELHVNLMSRLYLMRSIKYMAAAGFGRLLYEQEPDVVNHYKEATDFIHALAQKQGRPRIEYELHNNGHLLNVCRSALLPWEAADCKMHVDYCDDWSHVRYDKVVSTPATMQETVAGLQAACHTGQRSRIDMIRDFNMAAIGHKTCASYLATVDAPASYKESLVQAATALTAVKTEIAAHNSFVLDMARRNAVMAKHIAHRVATDGHAFGVFGLAHVAAIDGDTAQTIPDILRDTFNMAAVRVGLVDLESCRRVRQDMLRGGVDPAVIDRDEAMRAATLQFSLTPLEMRHVLDNDFTTDDGVRDVRPLDVGLDYAVILPARDAEYPKAAIVNKLLNRFAPLRR